VSTYSKGKEFEDQVAELYRLMGYEIKQNVGILGHQIDIILTYTLPGGIKTKTAVECKYIEKGNLRKNIVMDNVNALSDLKRNDEVQNLIIVTTNGFAKDVWDTAEKNKIQLLTFHELQHQILKLDQYLERLIKDFENDEISNYYIDLVAQEDEKTPGVIFEPMNKYIIKWIADAKINHVSILGEYGTGKTSFCRKFAHDLAIKYNNDPLNNRIPILINLRDYSKVMSVRQLITDLLINEYGLRGIDFPLFEKMNEEGLFLLIFDGFDEMAQKVIFDVTYSNFTKIAELAKSKGSKVLLTCRTEFFRTHEKEKEILLDIDKRKNFDIIYLSEFNDEQIKAFLQKRVPLIEAQQEKKPGWRYYYQKIHEIFDLKDLAKRPVLLELITKYLPQLIEKGEKINASTLYQTTIQEELKRRLTVGKTVIQREDRIKLMKMLAVWMYNNDKLSVYYEDIAELLNLKMHFDLKARTDIEYHLNDFLTCSFLNRDTSGNYQFSHKSFVDFLTAWKFVEDIEKDFIDDFAQKTITKEVMRFMRDFGIIRDKLYQWIEWTRWKSFSETLYLGGNAVSLLNELGEDFAQKGFDFSKSVLNYANFQSQDLTGLNFQRATLNDANLNNTILKNADFSGADLEGVSFEEMGKIGFLTFDANGKFVVAGCYAQGLIKILEVKTWKVITTLKGDKRLRYGVAFSPDNAYLASGSEDKTIKIWDVKTWKGIATLKGHNHAVHGLAFSPDNAYLASGSEDKTIKIWDVKTWNEIKTLVGHKAWLFAVEFSPDGEYLASSSADKTIKIWDVKTWNEIKTLWGQEFYGVVFSPDGWYLASGNAGKTIKIWDVETWKKIATLRGHEHKVYDVAFSPGGVYQYLASGSADKTIKIWDVKRWKEIATLRGHKNAIHSVAISPNGRYLASGSEDKTIKIWDANPKSPAFGKCLQTIKQQINCDGMNIKSVKGLDKEKMRFLAERGAIEVPKYIMEKIERKKRDYN
jgi:WD40 repeat protein